MIEPRNRLKVSRAITARSGNDVVTNTASVEIDPDGYGNVAELISGLFDELGRRVGDTTGETPAADGSQVTHT